MKRLLILPLLFLSACGYRFDTQEEITVSVPYVINDFEGELTDAIAAELSKHAPFRYTTGPSQWTLKAKILRATNDRIGYRYDRDPNSGELRKNVNGIENRKAVTVQVSVEESCTGKCILGPQTIKAEADYDYFDPNSLQDVSFINPATGQRDTSVQFSLGQLDNVGSAGENAIYPIYGHLAQKIVDGLVAAGSWDDDQ